MTVIGALPSFRELGEMSPHKRPSLTMGRINIAWVTWPYSRLTGEVSIESTCGVCDVQKTLVC